MYVHVDAHVSCVSMEQQVDAGYIQVCVHVHDVCMHACMSMRACSMTCIYVHEYMCVYACLCEYDVPSRNCS